MQKYFTDIRVAMPQNNNKASHYYSSEPEPFEVTYTPIKQGVFQIYLFGVIESAKQFIGAIEVLQAANENDIVQIHLSTDGGSLDATDTFIQAMHECAARVIVKASGGVHSAGTIILLASDEFTISDGASFLIHNGSCGSGGKYSDFKAQSLHTVSYMERCYAKHTRTS